MEYHPHDKKWIAQQLNLLPKEKREPTFNSYAAVFAETYAANEGKISQVNAARLEANNRLRKYVEKITRAGI